MCLSEFVCALAARSYVLGEHDCGLAALEWAGHETGLDLTAGLRGQYHNEAELAALAGPRGWPRLFDRRLRSAGYRVTCAPLARDIAIVRINDHVPRGALRADEGFVLIAPQGVTVYPPSVFQAVRAWTLRDG